MKGEKAIQRLKMKFSILLPGYVQGKKKGPATRDLNGKRGKKVIIIEKTVAARAPYITQKRQGI